MEGSVSTVNVPFERWKEAAGFPPEFPRLFTLDFAPGVDDARLYSPRELRAKRLELVQRLHRGELQVLVPIGHGATTIARWAVSHVERECLTMRLIPVLISLDDLVDEAAAWRAIEDLTGEGSKLRPPPEPTPGLAGSCVYVVHPSSSTMKNPARRKVEREADEAAGEISRAALDGIDSATVLDEGVHAAVARSLVTNRWERVIGEYRYASLLGADQSDAATLQSRRDQLLPLVRPMGRAPINWNTVGELSPQLADRAALVDVLRKNGIRVAVNLDLSCTRFGRFAVRDEKTIQQSRDLETQWFRAFVVERFLVHFKSQHDAEAGFFGGLAGEGVVSVTQYFSQGTADYFDTLYNTSTTRLETIRFDPLDVFTIVASHYPIDRTDQTKPELVSSVMVPGVIERVATASGLALTSMVHLLDDRLTGMDRVTYHLQLPEFDGLPDRVDKLAVEVEKLTGRVEKVERRIKGIDGHGAAG